MGRLTRAEVNAVCDYLEQRIHLEPAAVRAALAPYTEGEEPKAEDPHEWDGIHGGHRKRTDAEMDRMVETTRAAASPASEGPQGKTVRMRIAVAVDDEGCWGCAGAPTPGDMDSQTADSALAAIAKSKLAAYYPVGDPLVSFVEALVPRPAPAAEIQGSVTP